MNARKTTHGRPCIMKRKKIVASGGGEEGRSSKEELRRLNTTTADRGGIGLTEEERGIWWREESASAY